MKIFGIPYQPRQLYYVVGDLIVAAAAVVCAHLLRFGELGDASDLIRIPAAALFFGSVSVLTLYIADGYSTSLDFRRPQQLIRLWLAVIATLVLQMVATFFLPEQWWGRGISGLTSLSFGVLLSIWRAVLCWIRPGPVFTLRTLIVGDGTAARLIAEVIASNEEHRRRYTLVGALPYPRFGHRRNGDPAPEEPPTPSPTPILGTVADLRATVDQHKVELVIVAIRGSMSSSLAQQLVACKSAGVQIVEMPTIYKQLTGKVPILHLSDAWLIFGPVFFGNSRLELGLQRISDVLLSSLGLLLSAPFILFAVVAVKLETRGPGFFLQERLGKNEVPFQIIKLRTMATDAEAKTGAVWSQGPSDPRVTRVGRFLRRTRIDELPQFWNVLRGDMSIVGPRPERAFFVRQLEQSIPFYALRFAVKPGVTGWAQVNFRYGASTEEAAEKLCYELFAIQELTPVLYGFILLKTVQTMLLRPGS